MTSLFEHSVALVGFGEAATAFVRGWAPPHGVVIRAYDIKTDHPSETVRSAKQADFAAHGVKGCGTLRDALSEADVIFSLVTADQASVAATHAAECISPGAYFLDCNSSAPGTKRRGAEAVDGAGGRYVDVAIMAPVHPGLHKTPVTLSGRHADAAKAILDTLDMNARVVDGEVGAASSIKMIRSIMVKGFEALIAECVLAGCRADVDEAVLESLDRTYPGFDFKAKAAYMLERSMTHGIRRAAEMREVVSTVEELGLDSDMSRAIVEWQQRIGDLHLATQAGEPYRIRADRVLSALTGGAQR